MLTRALLTAVVGPVFCLWPFAGSVEADEPQLPLVYEDDFDQGAKNWRPADKEAWKVKRTERGNVYSQFNKKSNYRPPHRSPHHISLLADVLVSDFVLTTKVLSTHPDYGHRDVCLFFGYQDPAHFYYVHLGKKTDNHANQIFIVNGAPRTKISLKTTSGTNWDDAWHDVKIVRRVSDGAIEVYFDDMKKPVMVARDKTFTWGQVGFGSFDDTADWDDFALRGEKAERP
jgi:hypothetical protein